MIKSAKARTQHLILLVGYDNVLTVSLLIFETDDQKQGRNDIGKSVGSLIYALSLELRNLKF